VGSLGSLSMYLDTLKDEEKVTILSQVGKSHGLAGVGIHSSAHSPQRAFTAAHAFTVAHSQQRIHSSVCTRR
jgi:hypothetical protein